MPVPYFVHGATSLIGGGTGALDAIDGADLAEPDIAIVAFLNKFFIYSLDDDSGATESSPEIISPDANAGTKRWILCKITNSLEDLNADTWNQHLSNLLDPYGGMESFSSGAAAAPDGWALVGSGASVAREATIVKHGNYSAKLTRVTNDCYLKRDISWTAYYQSRKVTLGCWVYATVASRVRLGISDGTDSTNSSYHTGNSTWQFLTLTHTLNASASQLTCYLIVDTGDTLAYFDGAVLVEGTICPTYMPAVKPVYLTTPITDASWDGDAKSDGDSAILDLSAFGNGCPPGIKAILVSVLAKDSGSAAATDNRIEILPVSPGSHRALEVWLDGVTNDKWRGGMAWVPCDTNGDIYVYIDATGAGTMDVIITIWGYILGE